MEIDKDKVRTQEDEPEPAPIDQVEDRVEAEMKEIEERARKSVEEGLKSFDTDNETEK